MTKIDLFRPKMTENCMIWPKNDSKSRLWPENDFISTQNTTFQKNKPPCSSCIAAQNCRLVSVGKQSRRLKVPSAHQTSASCLRCFLTWTSSKKALRRGSSGRCRTLAGFFSWWIDRVGFGRRACLRTWRIVCSCRLLSWLGSNRTFVIRLRRIRTIGPWSLGKWRLVDRSDWQRTCLEDLWFFARANSNWFSTGKWCFSWLGRIRFGFLTMIVCCTPLSKVSWFVNLKKNWNILIFFDSIFLKNFERVVTLIVPTIRPRKSRGRRTESSFVKTWFG